MQPAFLSLDRWMALSCPGPTSKYRHECYPRTGRIAANSAGTHTAPADLGAAACGRAGNGNPQGRTGPSTRLAAAGRGAPTRRRPGGVAVRSRTPRTIAAELGGRAP